MGGNSGRKWRRAEDELTRYWRRPCSVEGRALECLDRARLTVTLGTRVIKWSFIVAEIAMAHELTVRPCEGAMYLPDLTGTRKEHMGERLPCTIRSVTEVRAITEETLAVWAMGPSSIPKWAPVGSSWGPTGAQLCPAWAQLGPIWNASWGTDYAGTTHRHASTSDCSYSRNERNSDDRNGAWTVGAVPSPRSS